MAEKDTQGSQEEASSSDIKYPSGIRLVIIVFALCICLFLCGLVGHALQHTYTVCCDDLKLTLESRSMGRTKPF